QALGILVKIFDTASFIPVHWHPDRKFAQKHLNSPFGKTEAWIIIATRKNAKVWIGWDRQITRNDVTEWYKQQNGDGMRSCMFSFEPEVGDIFYIPAGVPHSLFGCCVLEPQEPTDWSILAEWKMLGLPNAEAGLSGLNWQTALDSLTFDYFNEKRFKDTVLMKFRTIWSGDGNSECDILPEGVRQFFGASRLTVRSEVEIRKEGFYGIVVVSGSGYLRGFGPDIYLKSGVTLMMPHCLSDQNYTLAGNPHVQLFFFYPPLS
ncbi:MAG: mannose-6-phosphate isomerase, partial [Parcubacteria group bacterium LiPW_72]